MRGSLLFDTKDSVPDFLEELGYRRILGLLGNANTAIRSHGHKVVLMNENRSGSCPSRNRVAYFHGGTAPCSDTLSIPIDEHWPADLAHHPARRLRNRL